MRTLVVNAGSSTLKLRLVDGDETARAIDIDGAPRPGPIPAEVRRAITSLGPVDAVGHRVVHGGEAHVAPVVVDDAVLGQLEALTPLAPLHQPGSLAALRWARAALPDIEHVACFDTAFHAGMPAAARTYALPEAWRTRWPVRRFGFHGLSHAWAARRTAELLGRPAAALRIVTCHLGAGASLAAVHGGTSVDTTMGFTPLEGLVMATRSGSVDPGLVLWLQQQGGLSEGEIAEGLEHASGLLGLAGSADMRQVLAAAARGEAPARLAIDVYQHRLRAEIARMVAALGGLDALAFTGGVGERAPAIRAGAVDGLGFLGIALDAGRNASIAGDGRIDAPGSAVAVVVIEAREELEIARQVRAALA